MKLPAQLLGEDTTQIAYPRTNLLVATSDFLVFLVDTVDKSMLWL